MHRSLGLGYLFTLVYSRSIASVSYIILKPQAVSTNNELQNHLVFFHGPRIVNLFLAQTWYKLYFEKCGQRWLGPAAPPPVFDV